jgi:hypothetical protein
VVTDVKVPLATVGQVSTGEDMVIPGPASFAASTAAVRPAVTVSCAEEVNEIKTDDRINSNLV